jgi:di/tricarboxylate transporter
LKPWDALLVFGPRKRVEGLFSGPSEFIPLQELSVRLRVSKRWWVGALTIPLVVVLAATGVMTILKSAVLGVALLLATKAVRVQQAYRSVDWTVIFVLVGILPLGLAMEQTGLAGIVGETIVRIGQPWGPTVVLSLTILVTSIITEFLTNNSAAVLMVPIVLSVAHQLGIDPKPMLMGVTFAASMSFATPTGYQTNTMVYVPGGYRYLDYVKVGVPLNVLFWIVASLLIPLIWPF